MKVLRHLRRVDLGGRPTVLTLGNFDGVHCGHQEILRRTVRRARERNAVAVALSFYPHPVAVLAPDRKPLLLGTLRQRLGYMAASGIDWAVLQHFTTRFAVIEAERFVREFLLDRLRVAAVVVGHSVGFGHRRTGTPALLARMGETLGFDVEVVGPVAVAGQTVSSSAVRAAVARGDLATAAAMLGRPYAVEGRVVHGHHRGADIGFPTANLRCPGLQLPPDGVYAVRAVVGEVTLCGVTNVGDKPTFGDRDRSVETHLLDFQGELYGRRIEVRFVARVRDVQRFPNVDSLVRQIGVDVDTVRRMLARP
jgi:riboflavin kinase/FMN adenylyltransferase